ncbi:MAG: DoxX family protein [Gemmatimonadales bacterium]
MPEQLYPWMHLIGRILFSFLFIMAGINHLAKFKDMVAYAESRGAPQPKITVPLTGVMALVGGVFVVLGWHRFIGAGLIAIFLLLTAVLMHNFWRDTDPMARQNEMTHFMKNFVMLGAALFIAFYGGTSWPMSLGG